MGGRAKEVMSSPAGLLADGAALVLGGTIVSFRGLEWASKAADAMSAPIGIPYTQRGHTRTLHANVRRNDTLQIMAEVLGFWVFEGALVVNVG
jgi:hypothetical protein